MYCVRTAGIEASTALKIPEYTTDVAIDPLWSTHRMMSRREDRLRPYPILVSGMTVLYSGWKCFKLARIVRGQSISLWRGRRLRVARFKLPRMACRVGLASLRI